MHYEVIWKLSAQVEDKFTAEDGAKFTDVVTGIDYACEVYGLPGKLPTDWYDKLSKAWTDALGDELPEGLNEMTPAKVISMIPVAMQTAMEIGTVELERPKKGDTFAPLKDILKSSPAERTKIIMGWLKSIDPELVKTTEAKVKTELRDRLEATKPRIIEI